jgi:hypothetical protein
MLERAPQYRSGVDPFNENTADHGAARYRLRTPARTDAFPEESVPLFLSDYDSEPDPSEYTARVRKGRISSFSSRILAGVLVAAAVAILFAVFSSDAARDIIVNAKASSTTAVPGAPAAAQPDAAQLTARDIQLKDPARLGAPANQTAGVRSVATVAVAPTRAEITTAYQSALQSSAPAATSPAAKALVAAAASAPAPAAAPAPAPVVEGLVPGDAIYHLDPNEIISSLRRADALIASGDLAAARLVLRRAANAGDAHAAMTLAGTYDPVILEKLGVHGFVPDLAMARVWYEKAKQFGSAEAPQRLELLASKRQ